MFDLARKLKKIPAQTNNSVGSQKKVYGFSDLVEVILLGL